MTKDTGIYRKFLVERTDGSSGPGLKHEHCNYFVLDLVHDPFAIPALKAYADACREKFPALADDLDGVTRVADLASTQMGVLLRAVGAEGGAS